MLVNEEARENWTIIDLPALYEDPGDRPKLPSNCRVITDWRTEVNEALCPQRYTTADLLRIKEAVGPREFSSQYQQRPAPESGNLFNHTWWQSYDPEEIADESGPVFEQVLLSVDCTFTDNASSDYVVGIVVGTINMIQRLRDRHSCNGVVIEQAASGFAVYQLLRTKVPGLIRYNPHGRSKVAKASAIVPIVEAGNVYLPKYAPWLDAFINEFSLFPNAKNDDQVDALSQVLNHLTVKIPPRLTEATWGRQAIGVSGDVPKLNPFEV